MLANISTRVVKNFCNAPKITLPDLKYGYSALEPVISSKLLETHHKKHHQTYVNNLNAALQQFDGSYLLIQRPKPTSITIKWLLSPRPSNLISVAILTILSIGKTWPQSAKEEANSLIKIPPSQSKWSVSLAHMKI